MKVNRIISTIFIALMVFASQAFAGDEYKVDLTHSAVEFSVKHLGITNVKGNFTDFAGTIMYDEEDPTKSTFDVTINVESINTANEKRDGHLRSPDFFDAANYPTITLKSKSVEKTDDGYVLVGDLTIRDKTHEVRIPFGVNGPVDLGDRFGTRMGLEGGFAINRGDYNINFGLGEIAVGEEVKINIAIQAKKS